jgi:hypothetical protein
MEVRLYLSFARRYVRQFVFQKDGTLFGMASNLRGKLCDFPHVGHYMSPTTGADKTHRMGRTGPFSKTQSMGSGPDPGSAITKSADTATFQRARTQHRRSTFRVC